MTCKPSIAAVALRALVGSALFFTCFSAAFGDVLLRLQRISDTEVLLVGSGALGTVFPADNLHALFLDDPYSDRPAPRASHSIYEDSGMHAGSFEFNFANVAGSGIGDSFTNTIYIGRDVGVLPFPQIPSNEELAGAMVLRLDVGESFKPIGATGDVYWGTTTGNIRGVLSGTWEMVVATPVPEPGSIALMTGGLLLLAGVRFRRSTYSQ
jgi:hypothetical protein